MAADFSFKRKHHVTSPRTNQRPARIARWTVLFIVATAMMMGYFVNDVMSPLETLLEAPRSEGGLGWSPADYGFFSGAVRSFSLPSSALK
jgi:hypothetical protein